MGVGVGDDLNFEVGFGFWDEDCKGWCDYVDGDVGRECLVWGGGDLCECGRCW